ncbi:MAG: response regulator transcription factor [Planctomycetota bacterium]
MTTQILIVEDEKHIGVGIKYNLEAEGYRVTLVEDGTTALRLINNDPECFDLILLDLMLPGMSGYSVCETIRDSGLDMPILMLSARTLAEDRTRGFDVGANQYLSKPFDLEELLSRVKNLLQNHGGGNGHAPLRSEKPSTTPVSKIEFGVLRVDFDSHEVFKDDRAVRLPAKELKLLRYFVENENRVISRKELLAEVWEMTGNLQTRAVDQRVARLRKTIEVDSAHPQHLLTIRDAGYRFVRVPADEASEIEADEVEADEIDGDEVESDSVESDAANSAEPEPE